MVSLEANADLAREVAAVRKELDRLSSIEAIRACIYRVSRGTDRIDRDVLRSAFHSDATVHFGKLYDGPVAGWIETALRHQASQGQRQHLVGNIIIELDDDVAFAESYELDRHVTPIAGELRDLVLGARTLDRFERRDGEWRIVERTKLLDWGRAIVADDGPYRNSPLPRGADDLSDPSYANRVNDRSAKGSE